MKSSTRNILVAFFILFVLVIGYFMFFQLLSNGNQNELELLRKENKKLHYELVEEIKNNPKKTSSKKITKTHAVFAKNHHLKVVIISKDDLHPYTRSLVGSIHKFHKDIKIVIYGLKLHPNAVGELKLWSHVDYIDIDDFVASTRLKQKDPHDFDINIWKPIVMKHATKRYGKILYIDSKYHLTSSLYRIERKLEEVGSVFFQGDSKKSYVHCNPMFQGYKFHGFAYDNILVPSVSCAYRSCPNDMLKYLHLKDETTIPKEHKEALKCLDETPPFQLTNLKSKIHSKIQCHIKFRDDFLYSLSQLPEFEIKPKPVDDKRIYVALGFPSTSKNIELLKFENMVPFNLMIPSLLKTIKKDEKRYLYNLYLGFDVEDPYYDNLENQKEIIEKVKIMTKDYPITFTFVKCKPTFGWTSFLWNAVFQHAIQDSNDYFYQINDDVKFITPGWTEDFINKLKSNPKKSNLGVVGPTDIKMKRIFTQSFVHKTHHDIFGYFYPPVFRNWYSDDWITTVYDPFQSSFRTNKAIQNTNIAGTRYVSCADTGREHLHEQLESGGKKLIEAYLKDHPVK
eukprot:gene7801-12275_t